MHINTVTLIEPYWKETHQVFNPVFPSLKWIQVFSSKVWKQCPNTEKEKSEKVGLKFNIQKSKIMASGPITTWQINGEIVETVSDFILGGAPKSLQMVIAAMKLKDAYSLGGKLWPT